LMRKPWLAPSKQLSTRKLSFSPPSSRPPLPRNTRYQTNPISESRKTESHFFEQNYFFFKLRYCS
jgi:hypothetical protein